MYELGSLKIATEPTEEPVTLAEAKKHIRVDSSSFTDDISVNQSIIPGNHAAVASYGLIGTGVQRGTYDTLVILDAGTAGGTLDCKIQDSDDNSTYSDWSGSAFTQITTSNDNAIQEIAYTGNQDYIRVLAQITTAACAFAVNITLSSLDSTEDTYISSLIVSARKEVEKKLNQSLITQTWDYYLDDWPYTPFDIPLPPLQSVNFIHYTTSDLTVSTVATSTYRVDANGMPGRINLGFSKAWPASTLDTINGFNVRYISGYGTASSIPTEYKQAILLIVSHLYENREQYDGLKINQIDGVKELLGGDNIVRFA